ncbi:hypothetical protein CIB48_g8359 [Xylaria polymorpha]|nr:hypothetical protein CIB48_g8359 [Xylaria polymorpha]
MGICGLNTAYVLFATLHVVQFILSIVVIGLYGTDLDHARKAGTYADGKWVYAVVVASISAVTSIAYLIPAILRLVVVPIWSCILFLLWIILFGMFADMYIREDPEGNSGIQRMKNAIWVDLTNALLWFIEFIIVASAYKLVTLERSAREGRRREIELRAIAKGGSSSRVHNDRQQTSKNLEAKVPDCN